MINLNQAFNNKYKAQVELLLQIIPYVAEEEDFALKGGTAINMFIWDMPRLSVDIDLTYLPFDTREKAFSNIAMALKRIGDRIKKAIPGIQVTAQAHATDQEEKLICTLQGIQVIIEVNTTMRGSIKPARLIPIANAVQEQFGKFAEIKVMSKGELFGGKICAALDRQHPRDLFDVHSLLEEEGITEETKQGFIAALLSHSHSIHEMLNPIFKDQTQAFATKFIGMASKPFSYVDFEKTRTRLIKEIHSILTDRDKQLLLSFKASEPDWSLSNTEQLHNLPAVKWKLQNIIKLKKENPVKHAHLLKLLDKALAR